MKKTTMQPSIPEKGQRIISNQDRILGLPEESRNEGGSQRASNWNCAQN